MITTKNKPMNFWDGETCEYCNEAIVERLVTLHRQVDGQYVLIENVPAGVCAECETRYYAANVLKIVEDSIHSKRQAPREMVVPVYALA